MAQTISIPTLADLSAAAAQFAALLGDRTVVALYGGMGAGKTTFVRALCQELGVAADEVTSPTFAIVNEYSACPPRGSSLPSTVYHFDFYRIKRIEEVFDMGYEDYFYSGALCLIEWPELVEELLPADAMRVSITEEADGSRLLSF